MAAIIGKDGIHKLVGQVCDLCGQGCDGEKEELNALGCTYPACNEEASVYHQDCIEKYLRSIRVEKNRKTGYHCPRGSGKHSNFAASPCPGRVTKSHPIHIRNDQAKKRQKAKPAEPAPAPQKPFKGKGKAAAGEMQAQNKGKAGDIAADRNVKDKSAKVKAKPKAAEGQIRHLAGPSVKVSLPEPASKPTPVVKLQEPLKVTASLDRHQMKDAVYRAKLELGLQASPPVRVSKPIAAAAAATAVIPDPQVSKDEESTKASRPTRAAAAQPAVTAWQRSSSTASIVHSSSSAEAASDAGSLRSKPPRSLAPEGCTPPRQQLHHDSKSGVSAVAGPKDEQVHAAASPMTPNAIKAFQPDHLSDTQSDLDTPHASATGPYSPGGYSTEDSHRSSLDSHSICSDDVSDALFTMEPSSESISDELGAPSASLQALAHSGELEAGRKALLQGSDCILGEHFLTSRCLQDGSKTRPLYSSADCVLEKQAAGAALDQHFLQAVGLQKVVACAIQYQRLGYTRQEGIAAVNKWGADMHAALGWLLDKSGEVQDPMSDDAPTVDISDELAYLEGCQEGSLLLSLSTMESFALQASSQPMDVWTGGKEVHSALEQIPPCSIDPLSDQHPVVVDPAAPHMQGWYL